MTPNDPSGSMLPPPSSNGAGRPKAPSMRPLDPSAVPAPPPSAVSVAERPAVRTESLSFDGEGEAPAPRRRWKRSTNQGPARPLDRKWWQYEITAEKVKLPELMNFSRQCSSFVRSGIPIIDALELIAEESNDKLLRGILADTAEKIRNGSNLSDSLGAHAKALPPYYVPMIRAAELTGELDDVLDQLSEYLDREIESKRKIRAALTYPSVVVVMAIITVIVLAGFVLPRFKEFFEGLNAELPLPTRMLLAMTGFITQWYTFGLITFVGLVTAAVIALRTEPGKLKRDQLLLKLPGLGIVLQYAIVERFCRILSSMVTAGVPLPDAMEVASASSTNLVYRNALGQARAAMIRGEGLARPIAETGVFPSGANQMLRVGEQTGTLDQQLRSAATFYERELDYRMKRFTDLFEPAVIVVVGLVVGFVAIALVSAMYGVYDQVSV